MSTSCKQRPSDAGSRPVRRRPSRHGERGGAIVEAALLVPWLFFLFVGVLDLGFYYYALMAVQNAARVSAIQVSASGCTDSTTCANVACPLALNELGTLPNIGMKTVNGLPVPNLSTCTNGTSVTSGAPVAVSVTPPSGNTCLGSPPADSQSDSGTKAACLYSVEVTYLTLPMIPVPGIVPGQITMHRTTTMRISGS